MAHLWQGEAQSDQWTAVPLEAEAYVLGNGYGPLICPVAEDGEAVLLRKAEAARESWVLLTPSEAEVVVNGMPLVSGIHVLLDHDEIRLGGPDRLFFSTERLSTIEAFPGAQQPMICPRCKQPIQVNDLAVRCPNPSCGVWHHQTSDFNCWSYSQRCALCDQTTDLGGGYRWSPELL